jgi:hypothetical protein
MDFLGTCVWIWEFMILTLLPLASILMMLIFLVKIFDALPDTFGRFWNSVWRDKRGSK